MSRLILCRLIIITVSAILPVTAYAVPISGSVHDFSATQDFLDAKLPGVCHECHVAHGGFEIKVWGRDLDPDAVHEGDLCLDCHDDTPPTWIPSAPAWAPSALDKSDLTNSFHDFSGEPVTAKGHCFACHDLHYANSATEAYVGTYFTSANLWSRALTDEIDGTDQFYQKRDLKTTSGGRPNYLIGATVMCYDCHSGDAANNGPDDFDFSGDSPQDIAFAGTSVGYYELPDGSEPVGPDDAPALSAVQNSGAIPGGHFVKTPMEGGAQKTDNYEVRDPDSNLLYKISIGDKLPCDLCHDPHLGEANNDEVFFRKDIYAGEGQLVTRSGVLSNKLLASTNTRTGTGNGRLMCIYCHGTSDWPGGSSIAPLTTNISETETVYGIQVAASPAFPPPSTIDEHSSTDTTTPCTSCHQHNNINAACGGCHEYPPTTGAHATHASTVNGKPEFNCETCHGPSPGSASWHNDSLASSYDPAIHYTYITLMSDSINRGAESAYYYSTWTRSLSAVAPSVTKAAGYAFECANVYCHGMDTVNWNWVADTQSDPAGYITCGGCHGLTTDVDGDGTIDPDMDGDNSIDVSSFWSRGGTLYEATNAAANYMIPISGFSRGGHGDTNINNESPFIDSAPNSALPIVCVTCHDHSLPHFSGISSDPYRIQKTFGGEDPVESGVTNLCTQTDCHPKSGAGYATLVPTKHPSDHYPYAGSEAPIYVSGSKPIHSTFDPVNISPSVGIHIDRYVDHWEWWGHSGSSPVTGDDEPFLPLGDSIPKTSSDNFNNQADSTTVITCVTCHNPHGTDLFVTGQNPRQGSTFTAIPDNNMLRLRWEQDGDDEICLACH